jgi:hypothetical protein
MNGIAIVGGGEREMTRPRRTLHAEAGLRKIICRRQEYTKTNYLLSVSGKPKIHEI